MYLQGHLVQARGRFTSTLSSSTKNTQNTLGRLLFVPSLPKTPAKTNRYVHVARFVLPVLAGLILAAVVLGTRQETPPISAPASLLTTRLSAAPIPQNALINPRFEGLDNEGRPYTITAQRATQDLKASRAIGQDTTDPILLTVPAARAISGDGAPFEAHAAVGRYDPAAKSLVLGGGVEIILGDSADKTYTLSTQALSLDLAARRAMGTTPVVGHGTDGASLRATGFALNAATGHLIFTGPTRLVLAPQQILTSKGSLEWGRNDRIFKAHDTAQATQADKALTADMLEAHYDTTNTLTHLYARGKARLVVPEGILTAHESIICTLQTWRCVARGGVRMERGPQEWVKANTMTAFLKQDAKGAQKLDHIEAVGDVVVSHAGATVRGPRALIDVEHGTAQMLGGGTNASRIHAIVLDPPNQQ